MRRFSIRFFSFCSSFALITALTACGGGSSEESEPQTTPPPPSASISINPKGQVSSDLLTFSGNSSGITGPFELAIAERRYPVEPTSNGSWSITFSDCADTLSNGTHTATIFATDAEGNRLSDEDSFVVQSEEQEDNVVSIYYFRESGDYQNWGLHLWGEAVAPEHQTAWEQPRSFSCNDDGWAVARVPYLAGRGPINFIVHREDSKSPDADLSLDINDATLIGQEKTIWVVQGDTTLYSSSAAGLLAAQQLGNASSTLDLSAVTVTNTQSALPENWHRTASFMQIYVRAYSDASGDGVGDIQGLISKLDYLQDLGITGLWLMPVTASADNDHGYSVVDYRAIESDYGNLSDLQTLLDEAHARGIGVILDYVINHSASLNPLFRDASFDPENDKRNWYIFSQSDLGFGPWNNAWHSAETEDYYYGAFGREMPDFDLSQPEVEAFHLNNLRFWLNMGVDGFRIDAAGVLFEDSEGQSLVDNPSNHVFLNKIADTINQYDNRYLVCEAPEESIAYAQPHSCLRAFAFGSQWHILDSARDGQLHPALVAQLQRKNHLAMPLFLSNHDSFAGGRPMSYLLQQSGISSDNVVPYLKVASAINILASATPFTYYGEEVGMSGAQGSDHDLRRPMSWRSDSVTAGFSTTNPFRSPADNVELYNVERLEDDPDSLLSHYRMLFQLRQEYSALTEGELLLQSSANASHLVFLRKTSEAHALVVINLGTNELNLSANGLLPNTTYAAVYKNTGIVSTSDEEGRLLITMAPQSVQVWVPLIGNLSVSN